MRAVIYRVEGRDGPGAFDVAGRPLLERQLQWLRQQNVDEVAVELGTSDADVGLAKWLLGPDPLTHGVCTVPSDTPLGPRALAARAGFDLESGLLELPAHVLCEIDLAPFVDAAHSTRLQAEVPRCPGTCTATLVLRFLFGEAPEAGEPAPGWIAAIEDDFGALALGGMVLEGKLRGPLVHAAEQSPGIWVARGAHIAPGADLTGPVLVGPGAYIASDCSLGPLAVIGAEAVVERRAVVTESLVRENTVVGEGLGVRRALAGPHGLESLHHSERVSVGDSLVLTTRRPPRRANLAGRSLALLLALLLGLPWLLVATVAVSSGRRAIEGEKWPNGAWLRRGTLGLAWLDLWPRLIDVVAGRRFLFGATDPHARFCPAAFDIGKRLAPGSPPQILERMWPWYAAHKSGRLDRRLLTHSTPPSPEPS